ncbi:hypothetical protein FGO68_gene5309 [Halteria grandinella]|uniref:RING-type domain-containing protein n=1 Tax=Halteria grandinella TaxID=5974 RepID=A0A8J8T243_HALGN|nr:hypothetical protein FGO68_gene5309 [Halteria grandinella]
MKLRIKHSDLNYDINHPDSPHQFPTLQPTSPWSDLNDILFQLSEIPPDDQMVLYYGSEMRDLGSQIQNVGVHDGMVLGLADRRRNIRVNVILLDGTEVEVEYNNEEYVVKLKERIEALEGPMKLPLYRMSLFLDRENTRLLDYQEAKQVVNGDRIRQVRASFTVFGSEELQESQEMDCITLELPDKPNDFPHCKMPCGHVFSQDTIRDILIRKVRDEKAYEIRCPALKEGRTHGICNSIWDFPEFADYFTMTTNEEAEFNVLLQQNIHLFVLNYVQCPSCQALIPKPSDDPKLTRTHCEKCEQTEGGKADFCYKCGEDWKYGMVCQSDHCTFKKQNAILQGCIEIEVEEQTVPAVRACPNCKTLYEHMEACKHMQCKSPQCKDKGFEYCHVCLSNWLVHAYNSCHVAPRQVLEYPYQKIIEEEKKEEEHKFGCQNAVQEDPPECIEDQQDPEIFAIEEVLQHVEKFEKAIQQKEISNQDNVSIDETDYNEHYEYVIGIGICSIF